MNHPKRSDYRKHYKNLSLEELEKEYSVMKERHYDMIGHANKEKIVFMRGRCEYLSTLIEKKKKQIKITTEQPISADEGFRSMNVNDILFAPQKTQGERVKVSSNGLSIEFENRMVNFCTANEPEYAKRIVTSVNMHQSLIDFVYEFSNYNFNTTKMLERAKGLIEQVEKIEIKRQGWSTDITKRGVDHYYLDGISLCGKARDNFHLKHFDPNPLRYSHSGCCLICLKKGKLLK